MVGAGLAGPPGTAPYPGAVPRPAHLPARSGSDERLLVALDVDGTLLTGDLRLSDRVRAAVADVAAAGHHVVVATGRSIGGTLPVLGDLGLTSGWAVCSNGGFTVRLDPAAPEGHEVADVASFDPWPALQRVREVLPGAAYGVETADRRLLVVGPFPQEEMSEPVVPVPFEELRGVAAARVVVSSAEHSPEEFRAMTADLGLTGVSYAVGYSAWIDISPEGVSKASALEAVRERLEVAPGATVAVGDGRNDVEMLAWASRSAAMGGSPPEVVAAATEVAATIEADGAAVVLESLMGR